MDDSAYFFSANLDDGSTLYIAELADDEARAAGYEPDQAVGYFLYRAIPNKLHTIEVLARVEGHDAALELSRMLGLR